MKKRNHLKFFPLFASCALFLCASCASGPEARQDAPREKPAADVSVRGTDSVAAPPEKAESSTLDEMRELERAAREAFDLTQTVEGLKQLVAILAIDEQEGRESDPQRAQERSAIVERVRSELLQWGTRFRFEYTDEWMRGSTPRIADARSASRGRGLSPAVRLVANYEYGKSVVKDAPVRFAFIDGMGDLDSQVLTDSLGVAATALRSLQYADRPSVVRASLVISNRGKSIFFKDVFLDCSYAPLPRTAHVHALEVSNAAAVSARSAQGLLDAVVRALRPTGLDLLPEESSLSGESFTQVFSTGAASDARAGDATVGVGAADAPAAGEPAGFRVYALCEYDEAAQMVLNGKLYNIFTVNGRCRLRILRADGSIAFTLQSLSHRGQGGTPEAAATAFLESARSELEAAIGREIGAIMQALDE